jgi:hypothetical protein
MTEDRATNLSTVAMDETSWLAVWRKLPDVNASTPPSLPPDAFDRFIATCNAKKVAYDIGYSGTYRPPPQWGYKISVRRGDSAMSIAGSPATCFAAAQVWLENLTDASAGDAQLAAPSPP